MKVPNQILIYIMATASGAAYLADQAVWTRSLALIFGRTPLATNTVLAAFLGGLAAGSWLWGRVADRRPHAAFVIFAAVQMTIGLYGFASLRILHSVETLFLAVSPSIADRASLSTGVQLTLTAFAIFPPAMLMGGSLPLLARCMVSNTNGSVGAMGRTYGSILLGASAGAAATTCGLLYAVGLSSTVLLAATLNVLVGTVAFSSEMHSRKDVASLDAGVSTASGVADTFSEHITESLILAGLAASGFAATTFEVSWARLLSMVMGQSAYIYGALTVIILIGLGIGSISYDRRERATEFHQRRFAVLEFTIALALGLSMLVLPRLPFLFVRFFPMFRGTFGRQIAAHFVAAGIVAIVPSLLFGATLPAAVGSLGGTTVHFGRTVSSAYFANSIGNMIGVCVAGIVLLPAIGLHATMIVGVLAAVVAGFAVWWSLRAPRLPRLPTLAPAVAALFIITVVPAWPREVLTAGVGVFATRSRNDEELRDNIRRMRLLYYRDGSGSTISVDENSQTLFYRSNGKTNASTDPVDMANQLLLGHIPMLLTAAPHVVFILGLNAGLTAAAVARYPVQQVDIIEGEPAAAQATRFFNSYNRRVLDDPRINLIIGDGRSRLLAVPKQFDVIISDLYDIWVAGTGSLTTLEYYRIVATRLKSGGVFAQRFDTHGLLPDDLGLLAATFHAVFPHMQIWTSGPGNLIFLGAQDSLAWDYARIKTHFVQTEGVADDLKSVGIWQPYALFGAQILGENESEALARDIGEFHSDNRPLLEFRTPRSLYLETTQIIVNALNYYRRPGPPAIIGFDPKDHLDADGTYLLGFAYASVGQPDQAIQYMERSTKMAPDRPMFFVGLGNQYRSASRLPQARMAYERALELDLNNVEALVSLGEIQLEEGQLDWTRVLSDRALQLAPQNARVHALVDRLQELER